MVFFDVNTAQYRAELLLSIYVDFVKLRCNYEMTLTAVCKWNLNYVNEHNFIENSAALKHSVVLVVTESRWRLNAGTLLSNQQQHIVYIFLW